MNWTMRAWSREYFSAFSWVKIRYLLFVSATMSTGPFVPATVSFVAVLLRILNRLG